MSDLPYGRIFAGETLIADFGDGPEVFTLDSSGCCAYWKDTDDD